MTSLQRALMELEEAESQLARTLIAHGDGRAPAHAVATARWYAEQCRRRVQTLSDGEGAGRSGIEARGPDHPASSDLHTASTPSRPEERNQR